MQIFAVSLCTASESKTKSSEDVAATASLKQEADSKTAQASATATPAPAIIAIEIVDPNENKTNNKNSKRTIESNLGYGYEGNKPAKFEVYKYSQHDIPPYKGSSRNSYSKNSPSGQDFDIQKSIDYSINPHDDNSYYQGQSGYSQTPTPSASPLNQYYQPGTMLYTTLNNQGSLGDLTSNAPYQGNPGNIPVIVLRIHPEQLAGLGGGLYANLPQTHPFAANINSVDLQSLLANYVQNLLQNQQQQKQNVYQAPDYHHHDYHHGDYGFTNPGYHAPSQYYQPNYQQQYQHPYHYQHPQTYPGVSSPHLQTFENYPGDAHTKVIFKDSDKSLKSPTPSVASSPAYKGYSEESKASPEENKYGGHDSHEHVDDGYFYDKPGQINSQDYYSHDNYDKLDDKPNSQDYYSHDNYEKPSVSPNYFPEDQENYKSYSTNTGNEASYEVSQFHPTKYNTGSSSGYDGRYGDLPPVASDKSPDEPFNYHAHATGSRNKERSKKSSNIRMRIPKSLKKSSESSDDASRDKREQTE